MNTRFLDGYTVKRDDMYLLFRLYEPSGACIFTLPVEACEKAEGILFSEAVKHARRKIEDRDVIDVEVVQAALPEPEAVAP